MMTELKQVIDAAQKKDGYFLVGQTIYEHRGGTRLWLCNCRPGIEEHILRIIREAHNKEQPQ